MLISFTVNMGGGHKLKDHPGPRDTNSSYAAGSHHPLVYTRPVVGPSVSKDTAKA